MNTTPELTSPEYIKVREFESAKNFGILLSLAEFIDHVDKNTHTAKNGCVGAVIVNGYETNLRVIVFSLWDDHKVEVNRDQLEALASEGNQVQIVWYNNL